MMETTKAKRPVFRPDCDYYMDSARIRVRWALELRPRGELDEVTRELLEAVKHIDNARKMLREEKTQ